MKATHQGTIKEKRQAKSQINQINESQELLEIIEMEIELRKINFFVGGLTDEAIKFHYNRIFK